MISLDFELRWGLHPRLGLDMDACRENLEGVHEAVPSLLTLLAERGLRATWATVGALACRDWNEYFTRAPAPPRYRNPVLAFDPASADLDPEGRLHFAPELVGLVHAAPGQELGTHTFSHILLREPGVTAADVEADLAAVQRLWTERAGGPPVSLVFPRNQVAFPDVVRAAGIRVWRGTPRLRCFDENEEATTSRRSRALRLIADLGAGPRRASPIEGNVSRAGLFVRFGLPEVAWRLHVACLRRELDRTRSGEIFHLWWHPHNLGKDVRRRLARAREVLDLAAERVQQGRLGSECLGALGARR